MQFKAHLEIKMTPYTHLNVIHGGHFVRVKINNIL